MGTNTYNAYYNGKVKEVVAASSYEAQVVGAELFGLKPKQVYRVAVVLVKKDDTPVLFASESLP